MTGPILGCIALAVGWIVIVRFFRGLNPKSKGDRADINEQIRRLEWK